MKCRPAFVGVQGCQCEICANNCCFTPCVAAGAGRIAYMGQGPVCKLLLAHNADARYSALPKDSAPFLTVGGSAADLAQEQGHGPLASMLVGLNERAFTELRHQINTHECYKEYYALCYQSGIYDSEG